MFLILKELDQTDLLIELQRLIKDPLLSDKVLSLLNKLLNNKYPKFADSKKLQIQEILAWKLWPNFVKILGECINMVLSNISYVLYASV